jgi:hypothetical protein
MKTSKMQWTLLTACLLVFTLGASAQTPDHEKFWTTVGSAGTLDEKSVDKAFFNNAVVQRGTPLIISKGMTLEPRVEGGVEETDFAVIRYNVTAVDGLFGGGFIGMVVRYLDEGARVEVNLIEVNLASGARTTLLEFDSNDPWQPVQNGYHTAEAFGCTRRPQAFDFTKNAYYIEATLTTSSISAWSAAGIEVIQLQATSCF